MHNLKAIDIFDMEYVNSSTHVTGDVGDILNMCVHKFYGILASLFQRYALESILVCVGIVVMK